MLLCPARQVDLVVPIWTTVVMRMQAYTQVAILHRVEAWWKAPRKCCHCLTQLRLCRVRHGNRIGASTYRSAIAGRTLFFSKPACRARPATHRHKTQRRVRLRACPRSAHGVHEVCAWCASDTRDRRACRLAWTAAAPRTAACFSHRCCLHTTASMTWLRAEARSDRRRQRAPSVSAAGWHAGAT